MSKYQHVPYVKCYASHPPLTIGEYQIWGGSCIDPVVKDADVYVGFDLGMQRSNPKSYPWHEGQSFLFYIEDMNVPSSVVEFKNLLDYLQLELESGRKVHLGCIGGHGRTGLVLAALVHHMTGKVDAITYVRENYCQKAVESQRQVDWLHQHFGIAKVAPTKGGAGRSNLVDDWLSKHGGVPPTSKKQSPAIHSSRSLTKETLAPTAPISKGKQTTPVKVPSSKTLCVWGDNATIGIDKRNPIS